MNHCCSRSATGLGLLSSSAARNISARTLSCANGFRSSQKHQRRAFYERFYSISFPAACGAILSKSAAGSPPNHTPNTSIRSLQTAAALKARAPRSRLRSRDNAIRIPFGDLELVELQRIFNYDIGQKEGNIILRILHERRVSGSLIDLGVRIDVAVDLPQRAANNALDWLRQRYPVDEQAAAQAWAQREVQKLEAGYIERAERLGLYQAEPAEKTASQSTTDTSNSVIDEFRRYHEDRRAKEARRREESGEVQKEQELRLAKQDEAARKKELWDAKLAERKKYLAKQGMVKIKGRDLEDESIPELTTLQRLLPATLFGGACVATLCFFAWNYTPPTQDQRLFSNTPVSVATIGTIVGMNFAVYCLWYVPRFQRVMNKFMMSVPAYPYAFSMVGNVFSHQQFRHLAANMSMTLLYGITLHEELGRGNFLALYLSGGIIGSVASLYFYVLRNKLVTSHCGASGCVWAVTVAWAYLTATKPQSSTSDYSFAMDVSRYLVATINFLYHFTPGTMSTVDVIAHGAGALTGLVGAQVWRGRRAAEDGSQAHEDKSES